MNTTVEKVKQCRTPQEALLVLAAAIDGLIESPVAADPWNAPLEWPGPDISDGIESQIRKPDDGRSRIVNGEVIVAAVSDERKQDRAAFAVDTRLHEFYGDSLSLSDFTEAYIKGGPRWLYYTARDVVMQMPRDYRKALIDDVLLDSPEEAAEISRDILKFDESVPEGPALDAQRARLGNVA